MMMIGCGQILKHKGANELSITLQSNILKYLFKSVYFINGTAYAGKSTMVKMLADKYDGIWCGENYHDVFMEAISIENQPNLSYFGTMKDWQEFVNRTPEEYDDWVTGCSEEATDLEIARLIQLVSKGKKVFVDTNISIEKLKEISDYNHVAIMISKQSTSVERFFDREDEEKQFILSKIKEAKDPEKTMKNYRECLKKVNSLDKYQAFKDSGFFVLERDDNRKKEETMKILEKHFGL